MKKISINMLSFADKVEGQGVGSAYLGLLSLLEDKGKRDFEVIVNSMNKTDIIHIHSIDPINFFRMRNSKAIKVASVHFLGDTLKDAIKLPIFINNWYKKFIYRVYKKADYLVVVNPSMIKELEIEGIRNKRAYYIPNYVSDEDFFPLNKKEVNIVREKYNIPKNKFVVLGAGQLVKRKGILDFIEVAKKMPDVIFVWCGSFFFGKLSEDYEKLKKAYDNAPDNVIFLGLVPRKEMNDIYNMADVLFVPSYKETFGIVILEGAFTLKPIIARSLDVYNELFADNCLYGDSNDDFVKSIKILKDKTKYKEYQHKIGNIRKKYSKDNVYKMWAKFYKDIISNKKH